MDALVTCSLLWLQTGGPVAAREGDDASRHRGSLGSSPGRHLSESDTEETTVLATV